MKRKQRERASSTSKDEATAARLTGGGPMGLVRLRAIEHGVEENDLTSMNGLGEILPLLGRLKEGQVRGSVAFNRGCIGVKVVWCGVSIRLA